jgi:hypothetical protein
MYFSAGNCRDDPYEILKDIDGIELEESHQHLVILIKRPLTGAVDQS